MTVQHVTYGSKRDHRRDVHILYPISGTFMYSTCIRVEEALDTLLC
jgi:hypothetical protein